MFNFGLKSTLSGAALAFGLTFAPAANATTYVLQNGFMESARTLNIQGIGNAKSTAMQFDGFIDGTPDVPFTNSLRSAWTSITRSASATTIPT